ncbi:hypothetical protein PPGU19_098800 (plasmid) [Paraburkholderia sp. PGU19]|uniref:hypothetical protein n=1 Tax=Paraburkholderia sp. PGU19 TaxID=2735434 RepID=UPI0015DB2910|nr:hypothetical protein [Paraburkholderia sp. PGU19]BCG05312.1 hypothetical protein PPGU19_098800 [Paraburkholderia sp. PGU19]
MEAPTDIGNHKFKTADQPPDKLRVELRALTGNNAIPQLNVTDSDEREIFNLSERNGNIVFLVKMLHANTTYYAIEKQD